MNTMLLIFIIALLAFVISALFVFKQKKPPAEPSDPSPLIPVTMVTNSNTSHYRFQRRLLFRQRQRAMSLPVNEPYCCDECCSRATFLHSHTQGMALLPIPPSALQIAPVQRSIRASDNQHLICPSSITLNSRQRRTTVTGFPESHQPRSNQQSELEMVVIDGEVIGHEWFADESDLPPAYDRRVLVRDQPPKYTTSAPAPARPRSGFSRPRPVQSPSPPRCSVSFSRLATRSLNPEARAARVSASENGRQSRSALALGSLPSSSASIMLSSSTSATPDSSQPECVPLSPPPIYPKPVHFDHTPAVACPCC